MIRLRPLLAAASLAACSGWDAQSIRRRAGCAGWATRPSRARGTERCWAGLRCALRGRRAERARAHVRGRPRGRRRGRLVDRKLGRPRGVGGGSDRCRRRRSCRHARGVRDPALLSRRQPGWFLRNERFSVLGVLIPDAASRSASARAHASSSGGSCRWAAATCRSCRACPGLRRDTTSACWGQSRCGCRCEARGRRLSSGDARGRARRARKRPWTVSSKASIRPRGATSSTGVPARVWFAPSAGRLPSEDVARRGQRRGRPRSAVLVGPTVNQFFYGLRLASRRAGRAAHRRRRASPWLIAGGLALTMNVTEHGSTATAASASHRCSG